MGPEDRKKNHERRILGAVYDLSEVRFEPSERPDFAVWPTPDDEPIGVEVTQMFPNESIARMHLMDGYVEALWEGSPHRHRDDIGTLNSVRLRVTRSDGSLIAENLPGVITDQATVSDRVAALGEVMRRKADASYDIDGYRHLNLIVLDWFRAAFDASDFYTSDVLNDVSRNVLKSGHFNEVFVVIARSDTNSAEAGTVVPDLVVLRLMGMFLASEVFLAGHGIEQSSYSQHVTDVGHLNRLIVDHVTRVRGVGRAVNLEGEPHVLLGGVACGLGKDGGMTVRESADHLAIIPSPAAITDRLSDESADEVSAFMDSNAFGWAYTSPSLGEPDEPRMRTLSLSDAHEDE